MTLATGSNGVGVNSTPQLFAPLDAVGGRGMSPQSVTVAVGLNLAVLLVFLFVARMAPYSRSPRPFPSILNEPLTLPSVLLVRSPTESGGGGGNTGVAPPSHGAPPKFAVEQLIPPQVKPIDDPKLATDTTIDAQVRMAPTNVANIGWMNSALPGVSLGNRTGNGVGPGADNGYGPGSDRGVGNHVYRPGGTISAPQVVFAPEPEFSEQARKTKTSGNVLVYLQVDTIGRPMKVRVLRGIGMGLDEKAVEAVSHYKFKPAMENGHPVAVEMQVEVNFEIF